MRSYIFTAILLFAIQGLQGQEFKANSMEAQQLREQQLLGHYDSAVSFTAHPISSSLDTSGYSWKSLLKSNKVSFRVLPLSITQQFNTHHPYGWSDGAMIAANGYQALLSAGFYAKAGPLEMQVQPEWVYAANSSYETTAEYGSYGAAFYRLYPGQSTIKVSVKKMSMGFSTQNLWWGPGQYSSLLMSNNAPGFFHGFFKSNQPVKTPIGNLEWQLIGGKITENINLAYENANLKPRSFSGSRYLNAYVISFNPKWTPGLFVGMTRALQRYKADIDKSGSSLLQRYIPVLVKALQKQDAISDDTMRTDQLASFFLRWAFLKAKAEFYMEYGFNDYNYNVRDYLMGPTHSAAYLIGAKKVVDLSPGVYLDLNFEMTQMSQTPEYILREAGNWYVHSQILEGYTNDNQILGAGAGLGCNVQTLSASWVKGLKRFGIMFERVERDPQYHANKWIDFGIGFLPQWQYGKLLFSGKLQFINSSQYAWQKDVNRFNLHSRLMVQYSF